MVIVFYKNCVRTKLGITEWFNMKAGLRQRILLSSLLFLIIIKKIQSNVHEKLPAGQIRTMVFIDDSVVWSNNEEQVQKQVNIQNQQL